MSSSADIASFVYSWELEKRLNEINRAHTRAIGRLMAKTERKKAAAIKDVEEIRAAVKRAVAKAKSAAKASHKK